MVTRHDMTGDPAFFEAIGRAIYAFALLEWNALWCCERLKPGSLKKGGGTAQSVVDYLPKVADQISDAQDRADWLSYVAEFRKLIEPRNAIVHGKPVRDWEIERHGVILTKIKVEEYADAFIACSQLFNNFLHQRLSPNFPSP